MCGVWLGRFRRRGPVLGLSNETHLLDVVHFWLMRQLHLLDCFAHHCWDHQVVRQDHHYQADCHQVLWEDHPLAHHHYHDHHHRSCPHHQGYQWWADWGCVGWRGCRVLFVFRMQLLGWFQHL